MNNIIMNTEANKTPNIRIGELNLNRNEDFDQYINDMAIKEVKEAVKYFSKTFRVTEDTPFDEDDEALDEFVLMHKSQVDLFKQMNTNPQVKIRIEYLDEQEKLIYGYILYREHPKGSHKKPKKIKSSQKK